MQTVINWTMGSDIPERVDECIAFAKRKNKAAYHGAGFILFGEAMKQNGVWVWVADGHALSEGGDTEIDLALDIQAWAMMPTWPGE